jgi:hypothetical protein
MQRGRVGRCLAKYTGEAAASSLAEKPQSTGESAYTARTTWDRLCEPRDPGNSSQVLTRAASIRHLSIGGAVRVPGTLWIGYVTDHVAPSACGGADAPENMHWQTVTEAKTGGNGTTAADWQLRPWALKSRTLKSRGKTRGNLACSKCRSLVRTSASPSLCIVCIEMQSARLYPLSGRAL